MSTISRYVIVNDQDHEEDHEYDSYDEAETDASARVAKHHERLAIIERQYEYTDSELVWTSTGADHWPPRGRMTRTR